MRLFTWIGLMVLLWARATLAAPAEKIEFTQETLDNGLHVIYAPLHTAPVVHVRVIYHVGSRDERPDRQGFAHMFEHMMFRGSAHVQPEEHMKLVGIVGGYSNAFTSFDQTVYHETLPSTALGMALYLEADRMASFKVSDNIFKTERNVVAEEWRLGHNRPYGSAYEDFLKSAFTSHSYRWTPIGNMDQLKESRSNELQEFFNTYYLPNNAALVIAGDFQTDAAKEMVRKYFGWIPKGPDVKREVPQEPEQTASREAKTYDRVPLTMMLTGYKVPPYRDPDNDPLELLSTILGGGRGGGRGPRRGNRPKPPPPPVEGVDMGRG
jgi:zinc protease